MALRGAHAAEVTVAYDQERYIIQRNERFPVQIRIQPAPAAGLFSFGVRVGFPEAAAVVEGAGSILPSPVLANDGPNGMAPVVGSGPGFAAAKGSADLFNPGLPVSTDGLLVTFWLRDQGVAPYKLTLSAFNTLGPTEQLFVDGLGGVLDQELKFGSAEVVYGDKKTLTIETNSAVTLNRQTGLFEQKVRVKNQANTPVSGFRLLVTELPSGWSVWNLHGTTNLVPFVDYHFTVAAGETVDLRMEFRIRDRNPNGQPKYGVEPGEYEVPPDPDGTPFAVIPRGRLADGAFLLEFDSLPGRFYTVQYSYDLTTWTTVVPSIPGNGSRVQWIDGGPPKSDSHPDATRERYYRIFLLP